MKQFNIADIYDIIGPQLDADVHQNDELSESEVNLCLNFSEAKPHLLYLPCAGTGRHLPFALAAGVEHVSCVDLSHKSILMAAEELRKNPHLKSASFSLNIGDVKTYRSPHHGKFDAVWLLGNSFADCTDENELKKTTKAMADALRPGGIFVMDYIGREFLGRCRNAEAIEWPSTLKNEQVIDRRTPHYDSSTRTMTIRVEVRSKKTNEVRWQGEYQKLILSNQKVREHFHHYGIHIEMVGPAVKVNPYYEKHDSIQLGTIGLSNWWVGRKQGGKMR